MLEFAPLIRFLKGYAAAQINVEVFLGIMTLVIAITHSDLSTMLDNSSETVSLSTFIAQNTKMLISQNMTIEAGIPSLGF